MPICAISSSVPRAIQSPTTSPGPTPRMDLPFDAEAPADRVAVCLNDAEAKALLVSEALRPQAPEGTPALTTAEVDQQFGAAGHPKPHDVPRTDAADGQPGGDGVGAGIDLRIGQDRTAPTGAGLGIG
jgi:hypothetical protein